MCNLSIMYCDVKSSNILFMGFDYLEVVMVVDFGFLRRGFFQNVMYVFIFVKGIVGYFDFQ